MRLLMQTVGGYSVWGVTSRRSRLWKANVRRRIIVRRIGPVNVAGQAITATAASRRRPAPQRTVAQRDHLVAGHCSPGLLASCRAGRRRRNRSVRTARRPWLLAMSPLLVGYSLAEQIPEPSGVRRCRRRGCRAIAWRRYTNRTCGICKPSVGRHRRMSDKIPNENRCYGTRSSHS